MNRFPAVVIAVVLTALVLSSSASQQGQPEGALEISWHTMDSGGGASAGGAFALAGTIGQYDAGSVMSGGGFTVTGGFWNGGVIPVPDCPPDIAPPGGDGVVNIDDLLLVINQWGVAGGPADINHDNIVNIDDLLAVITAWGACP